MGTLEDEARKRRRLGAIQSGVLAAVGIAGILLVAAAAPKALEVLRYLPKNKYRFTHQSKSALSRLAVLGHIRFQERRGKRYAEITEQGRRVLTVELFKMQSSKKRGWDKRWRVIIFDIPEKRRYVRDALRSTMRELGFYRLQDSVWVYPHDCEDVVALVKTEMRVGAALLYMIVEKLENDSKLKEHFGIS